MRHKSAIWLILFMLFLIETSIFHWIIPASWMELVRISPRFVFVVILFVSLFINRHFALLLGLVFGVLNDIMFYGFMVGPYAFGMGVTSYLIGFVFGGRNYNLFLSLPIIMLGFICFELINYSLYRLFRIVDLTWDWVFVYHMMPSFLINLLFAIAAYIPIRMIIEQIERGQKKDEGD